MKKILFFVLILATLILASCDESGEGTQREQMTASFIGGTQGIVASFVEGAPPQEVLDGGNQQFALNIELKNMGETQIDSTNIKIDISGISPADFSVQNSDLARNSINMDLFARRRSSEGQITDGGQTYVEFTGFNYVNDLPEGGSFPANFNVDLCYKYANRAVSRMCVRRDLLRAAANSDDGCEVRADKTVFNSGGPVHITNLKQFPTASDKISFTFTLEKVGPGNIFRSTSAAPSCQTGDLSNENKVLVEVITGLDGSLSCDAFESLEGQSTQTNQGYVSLYSNKRMVTCVQTLTETLDYEKVIEFKMDYVYGHRINNQVLVKSAGN